LNVGREKGQNENKHAIVAVPQLWERETTSTKEKESGPATRAIVLPGYKQISHKDSMLEMAQLFKVDEMTVVY